MLYPLQTVTITSAGIGIVFDNIPNTFRDLQIRITGRANLNVNNNSSPVILYFNNDTAGNYSFQSNDWGTSGTSNQSYIDNRGVIEIQRLPANQSPYPANLQGSSVIDIINYKNTTNWKIVRGWAGYTNNLASSFDGEFHFCNGLWKTTNAITRIAVEAYDGWAIGTKIDLYGLTGTEI